MTKLTEDDIKRISSLARLKSMDDVDKQRENFNKLLKLFEQVNAVDTKAVAPLSHPIDEMSQPLREDNITTTDQHEYFQKLAPKVEAAVYLVPKVIDNQNE